MKRRSCPAELNTDSMALAAASLEVATASLDGFCAHVRAAGLPDLTEPAHDILAQMRAVRFMLRLEGPDDEELVGGPPADWFLSN